MRVSKEPEIRKQEIIDSAMKVFADKGFEAATMKDIAREAGVVSGLCYHYFQNKHQLYQTAVIQYAKECSSSFVAVFKQTDLSLDESMHLLGKIAIEQSKDYKYKDFFNGEGNELFHKQLELYMSNEIFPYMQRYLECLAGRNAINVNAADTDLLARFIWSGQMSVINKESIPINERFGFIRQIIDKILN